MKIETTLRSIRALSKSALCVGLMMVVGLSGCAAPPPVTAPVAEAPKLSRAERIAASLTAMNFQPQDDGWHLSLPAPLIFKFDSDVVSAEARDNLILVARELRTLGIDNVLVRGHTDAVGTREYNIGLSQRRADAVARVLAESGFPSAGIDVKGMGSGAPVAENSTAEGRAKNRRVVIIVEVHVTLSERARRRLPVNA